ncbi:hypothetical protein DMENIID0001_041840 [Sergentomyia squamirostris]
MPEKISSWFPSSASDAFDDVVEGQVRELKLLTCWMRVQGASWNLMRRSSPRPPPPEYHSNLSSSSIDHQFITFNTDIIAIDGRSSIALFSMALSCVWTIGL